MKTKDVFNFVFDFMDKNPDKSTIQNALLVLSHELLIAAMTSPNYSGSDVDNILQRAFNTENNKIERENGR